MKVTKIADEQAENRMYLAVSLIITVIRYLFGSWQSKPGGLRIHNRRPPQQITMNHVLHNAEAGKGVREKTESLIGSESNQSEN